MYPSKIKNGKENEGDKDDVLCRWYDDEDEDKGNDDGVMMMTMVKVIKMTIKVVRRW